MESPLEEFDFGLTDEALLGLDMRAAATAAARAAPALAASAFGLLDVAADLRLVTDLVHEDDALCLALTCRGLRDALWARFPSRPAGDAFAGARVRTRDEAVVSMVGRLVWARGLDRPWPGPRNDWEPNSWRICSAAAACGALASLQWARANG